MKSTKQGIVVISKDSRSNLVESFRDIYQDSSTKSSGEIRINYCNFNYRSLPLYTECIKPKILMVYPEHYDPCSPTQKYFTGNKDKKFYKFILECTEGSVIIDEFGAIYQSSTDFLYYSFDYKKFVNLNNIREVASAEVLLDYICRKLTRELFAEVKGRKLPPELYRILYQAEFQYSYAIKNFLKLFKGMNYESI